MSEPMVPDEFEQELEEGTDYIMPEGCNAVWISAGNVSIHVHKTEAEVIIEMYALNYEMKPCYVNTFMSFEEAKHIIDESEKTQDEN
jgi:hypothetical protein